MQYGTPNGVRYAKIGLTTDINTSHLRVQKNDSTKAILYPKDPVTQVGTWTDWGSLIHPPVSEIPPGDEYGYQISTTFSAAFNFNRVMDSTYIHNLQISFATNMPQNNFLQIPYGIDGIMYTAGKGHTQYHRLSTGNHTITLYAYISYDEFSGSSGYFDSFCKRIV